MSPAQTKESSPKRLRLWPGVTLVLLMGVLRFGVPLLFPEAFPIGFLGAVACGLLIAGWWLFFSRVPWIERIATIALIALALFATKRVVHPSIAGGMMGMMPFVVGIPVVTAALVVAVTITQNLSTSERRVAIFAGIMLGSSVFALLRTGGITSMASSDFHWRWTETPEERLLAQSREKPKPVPVAAAPIEGTADWPGFRGANRDSVLRGVSIDTNWAASPPKQLWRREVGPGWSSFAVRGELVYTQEQRGDDEVVACYQLTTGAPVWQHGDATRFYESNAGPGPRGTPTLHEGRVYALGATGVLNALDASTGAVVWTRNAADDTKNKPPEWGISSSPLVLGDQVIVAVTGTLAAYDRATGAPRWTGPAGGKSYSSPHLLEIAGVPQIVLMSGTGATGFAPADGKVLWQYAWPGFAIVQPAQIANGDLLVSTSDRAGARRIEISRASDTWAAKERWTSMRLKAYFNDYVLHRGHAFGFDGGILTCVELENGERKWKGGRYGSGQVLLLADQDVLIVLSEQGGLALVRATPDEFVELGSIPALEGKTWNHPVLAGDVLLVRNDHEMAAFRVVLKRG